MLTYIEYVEYEKIWHPERTPTTKAPKSPPQGAHHDQMAQTTRFQGEIEITHMKQSAATFLFNGSGCQYCYIHSGTSYFTLLGIIP